MEKNVKQVVTITEKDRYFYQLPEDFQTIKSLSYKGEDITSTIVPMIDLTKLEGYVDGDEKIILEYIPNK